MINLKLIETNYDEFNAKLKAKKVDDGVLATLLEAYNSLKAKKLELENIQAIQNAKSKELGIKARNKEDVSELKAQLEINKKELQTLSNIVNELELNLEKIAKALEVEPYKLYMYNHNKNKEDLLSEIENYIHRANDEELKLIYKILSSILD